MNSLYVWFWSAMILGSIAWYAILLFYLGVKGDRNPADENDARQAAAGETTPRDRKGTRRRQPPLGGASARPVRATGPRLRTTPPIARGMLPRGDPFCSRGSWLARRFDVGEAGKFAAKHAEFLGRRDAQLNAITADANDRQFDILSKLNLFALATRKDQHKAVSVGKSQVWAEPGGLSSGRAGRVPRAWRRDAPGGIL